jgi:CCR4-NOT transcription complex subunit 1
MHLPVPAPPPGADDAALAAVAQQAAEHAHFNAQVLVAFANVLHACRPERVPGFAFGWLELASHRLLFPPLLAISGQRGWALALRLLLALFRFLYPALRRAEMNAGVRLLYKGGLRLMLVLHHDAPEFLADYAAPLLGVLPPACIQLRNLLLSAAPRAVRLPDPFAAAGAVDAVPECAILPRLLGAPGDAVPLPPPARADLDAYLRTPAAALAAAGPPAARVAALAGSALGAALRAALVAQPEEQAFTLSRYSAHAIQTLVLHVADVVLARAADDAAAAAAAAGAPPPARGTVPPPAVVASAIAGPAADVFNLLLGETDAEARYALLNAVVNQLRFPNAHTLFYSTLLLRGVFLQCQPLPGAHGGAHAPGPLPAATADVVREQLTRVLLERVIVHRPHPWGLLVTFIELIRNPGYAFWAHGFTRVSPEAEK